MTEIEPNPNRQAPVGLATIQITALTVVLWCCFAFAAYAVWAPFPISASRGWAFLLAIAGLIYAVPAAFTMTVVDMLARRLRFPWSSIAFAAGVAAWLLATLAVSGRGGRPVSADAWIAVGACLPGALLFLRRQFKLGARPT